MAQKYADTTRVHVEIMKSVLATSFVGYVMKISLMVSTVAENPIPVVKIIQVPRPAALTWTNVILMRETVKMTATVPEFSNVVIAIVVTTFQMGPIVVNSQVPLKEVSFSKRIQRFGCCSMYRSFWYSNVFVFAGPGLVCDGANFLDLFDCCTEEHQCGLYQGDCKTDSQCKGNLKCGLKNCKLTSQITSYAGHWQAFNCCYNGMSSRKKNVDFAIIILLFFRLEQKSLSCHVPKSDDSTVKECEEPDSPCIIKKIGMNFEYVSEDTT